MALKLKGKVEVKHIFLQTTEDELNKVVGDWLASGWQLYDCRILNIDQYNKYYGVFYIFGRNMEATKEE